MGHRVNYIIKEGDKVNIYYSKWGAVHLARDIALGPEEFILFIRQFELHDELMYSILMEACVIVDMTTQSLSFFEQEHLFETSVRKAFITLLQEKWKAWSINYLEKGIGDIVQILDKAYINITQSSFKNTTLKKLKKDKEGEYISSVCIIKKDKDFSLKALYNIGVTEVLLLGKDILLYLEEKPDLGILNENEVYSNDRDIVLIDFDDHVLYLNEYIASFDEYIQTKWMGWQIKMGDFGYINILNMAGYDTAPLIMDHDSVLEEIQYIFRSNSM